MKLVLKLLMDEEGQGMLEYVLIIGLVAVGLIAALLIFSGSLNSIWDKIIEEITNN